MKVAVVIAVIGLAATIVIAALSCSSVDLKAVMRFIAPTAFETLLIEVLIEGRQPESANKARTGPSSSVGWRQRHGAC